MMDKLDLSTAKLDSLKTPQQAADFIKELANKAHLDVKHGKGGTMILLDGNESKIKKAMIDSGMSDEEAGKQLEALRNFAQNAVSKDKKVYLSVNDFNFDKKVNKDELAKQMQATTEYASVSQKDFEAQLNGDKNISKIEAAKIAGAQGVKPFTKQGLFAALKNAEQATAADEKAAQEKKALEEKAAAEKHNMERKAFKDSAVAKLKTQTDVNGKPLSDEAADSIANQVLRDNKETVTGEKLDKAIADAKAKVVHTNVTYTKEGIKKILKENHMKDGGFLGMGGDHLEKHLFDKKHGVFKGPDSVSEEEMINAIQSYILDPKNGKIQDKKDFAKLFGRDGNAFDLSAADLNSAVDDLVRKARADFNKDMKAKDRPFISFDEAKYRQSIVVKTDTVTKVRAEEPIKVGAVEPDKSGKEPASVATTDDTKITEHPRGRRHWNSETP